MLARIIWGMVFTGVGVVAVIYARKIVEFTGTSATLETYLGSGGTYLGLRIFGVFLAFFGILYMFGFLGAMFGGVPNVLV